MSESASATSGQPERARANRPAGGEGRRNVFARIALFVRQVVAELTKVVRPTRSELLTFFVVVIVFVLAVMAYVGVLDLAFGQLMLWLFG